ncbi:MAG: hypothetical protein D6765_05285 [Bacteroidetes bacterium]|nr:MAG: hypothetical protein D6765_05285 [Bacteroidota bacterium]
MNKRLVIFPFLIVGLLFGAALPLRAQLCECTNCPVPIVDNGVFEGYLSVTVNGPNDLSQCPLQQVCFGITHTWVGDLSVSLIAPNGVNYLLMADDQNAGPPCGNQNDNLQVCIETGTGNPLTNNTPYNCNGTPGLCLVGSWTVPCGGVTDPMTGGVQAPNCDLDDFNQPGAPANGTWTLVVADNCDQDVGFLTNFSLFFECGVIACFECEAEGGSLNQSDIQGCVGDPDLNLNITPNYGGPPPNPADYAYTFLLSQNGTIVGYDAGPNMSVQAPGTYTVCGLSHTILASAELPSLIGMDLADLQAAFNSGTPPFCGDLSDDCFQVVVGIPPSPTVLDTAVCLGECLNIGGQMVCSSQSITLDSWLGCDSVVTVILNPLLPSSSLLTVDVCEGECVRIGGITYCPPGPHTITRTNWLGCDSTITLQFEVFEIEAVVNPNPPDSVSCSNPFVTLDGMNSSPDGVFFRWEGPDSFLSVEPTVDVGLAGDYTLTVGWELSPGDTCFDQVTVTVPVGADQPDLHVLDTPLVCQGTLFNLHELPVVDSNFTGAVFSYHSASPADSSNLLPDTLLQIDSLTTVIVRASLGDCASEIAVTLDVTLPPTALFDLADATCLGEAAVLTFTGDSTANTTFAWDFDGGSAQPGALPGTLEITWNTPGSKVVTLLLDDGGCQDSYAAVIEVQSQLPQPVVACTPSLNAVTFTWSSVPGAQSYAVNTLQGPPGSLQNDTTWFVPGLNPGDQVEIEVIAVSGTACPNATATATCLAQDCPNDVVLSIAPVDTLCLGMAPLPLTATVTGGNGGGTLEWSGPGIADPATGLFDPNLALIGTNAVVLTYREGSCSYVEGIDIAVFPEPTPDFTLSGSVCLGDPATVTYTGSAASDARFFWDFDGGVAVPGTGPGPQQVSWADTGTFFVTLQVEALGCLSPALSLPVRVEAPLTPPQIQCAATTESVQFSWNPVVGAGAYTLDVLSGHVPTLQTDTLVRFEGLQPGEEVVLSLEIQGNGTCPDLSLQQLCAALDCPPTTLDIQPVDTLCLGGAVPFTLSGSVNPPGGTGTLTWSGPGIVDPSSGLFDPAAAGPGTHLITLRYEEGNCSYETSTPITLQEEPTADFSLSAGTLCTGAEAAVTFLGNAPAGAVFHWDFDGGVAVPGTGAGPHLVTWSSPGTHTVTLSVEAGPCLSAPVAQVVEVEAPPALPVVNCNTSTQSVEFVWNADAGIASYNVVVTSGQAGQFTSDTSYLVAGLQPLENVSIELTGLSVGPCPPVLVQAQCAAVDCPDVSLNLTPVPPICLNATTVLEQLEVQVIGGSGSGQGQWSGPGIVDAQLGLFDPVLAGVGTHQVLYTYSEDNCSYAESLSIEVRPTPTAAFTLPLTACRTEPVTVTFSGQAGPGAQFSWDFDGGTALPGTGPGPHQVTWNTPGTKTITLSVSDGGCSSEMVLHQVEIVPELEAPQMTCTATTSSVEFAWAPVAGAQGYNVVVVQGPAGVLVGQTAYRMDGLEPGQEVALKVEALGDGTCPPAVSELICAALECPDVLLEPAPAGPFCLDGNTGVQLLEVSVSGGQGGGNGSWAGPGLLDATLGLFDPALAGPGEHTLTYAYSEDNCSYQSTLTIQVSEPPVADAGADFTLTCEEDAQSVVLGGASSAGPHIVYRWSSAGGAFPGDSTAQHPEVAQPGTYLLTVTDTLLGCASTDAVVVDAQQGTPVPEIVVTPISCHGERDGIIEIVSVSGGSGPYLFALNSDIFSTQTTYPNLGQGSYKLVVQDVNGCENTLIFDLNEPEALHVSLSADTEIENRVQLGDSVRLHLSLSIPADSLDAIVWEPAELLDCRGCPEPTAFLLETTTFTVTVEKNGCTDSDQLTLFVDKQRPVFVPNAFSPDGDGINDRFTVFAGQGVAEIRRFRVFNRWGEPVYEAAHLPPNDPTLGWDGTYRGQALNPAVFVWFVEVEFVDGSVEVFKGDVALLR